VSGVKLQAARFQASPPQFLKTRGQLQNVQHHTKHCVVFKVLAAEFLETELRPLVILIAYAFALKIGDF